MEKWHATCKNLVATKIHSRLPDLEALVYNLWYVINNLVYEECED